jgi:hypothetical protein
MKKTGIIILLTAIIMYGFCLKVSADNQYSEKQGPAANKNESTKMTVGKDLPGISENDSSLNLKTGNKGLTILESLESMDGSTFSFNKCSHKNDYYNEDNENEHTRKRSRFRGHWTGIEFGFNNYVTTDMNTVMPSDIYYMSLNSGKSSSFNLNFAQESFGFTRYIGLVTGLGINWNNYRFDNNNNIMKGENGVIEELRPDAQLEKSKLTTVYMTVPLIFEFHIPADHHHLNIGAGIIGAIKLGSHSKMVFEDGNKIKSFSDFNLSLLRYGPTVRIGYQNLQLYATYYETPLFKPGKSPGGYDLHPFEIGIALTFND